MSAEYGADQIPILEGMEADPVCISAVPRREDCIIWYMRL